MLCLLILLGCNKEEIASQEKTPKDIEIEVTINNYEAKSITSAEVLERAWQMANVSWTPINKVPQQNNSFYQPGKKVTGIPYSSVKEINTYLFQDVSYHTFMTAVHNPRSVLYTENISRPPYHGTNCAPYYGGVCSSTILFALGISIPYYVNQIVDLPFFSKLKHQEIDSLKVCDIICKRGHAQMVYSVEHRADTLYKISLFESSGKSAHISNYTAQSFKKIWTSNQYVAYRYDKILYTTNPDSFKDFDPIEYNDDLCPSKGDKAVYRTDDTVTINIFNPNYQDIVLQIEDEVIVSDTYDGDLYQFSNLNPGIYTVYLRKDELQSMPVSFEIIKTDVDVTSTNNGKLLIRFNSSALADYVALCAQNGSSEYYPISENDRASGYIVVPRKSNLDFCKVVFIGHYGTIINSPIKIKN